MEDRLDMADLLDERITLRAEPVVLLLVPVIVSLVFGLLFASAILLFFVAALLAVAEGIQQRLSARGVGGAEAQSGSA